MSQSSSSRWLPWAFVALAALAVPRPVHAEPHVRNAWFLGVGYGGGWADVQIGDLTTDPEWSGLLNARAGYALRQDLLLGGEYTRWAKDYAYVKLEGDVPVTLTLSGITAAVTYFPGNAGFMLRGGVGVSVASVDVRPPDTIDFPVSGKSSENGIAMLAAMGYEARVSEKFALGLEFDVAYLGIGGDVIDHAYLYGLNLQLNWYW
ncbi:MAG TPA: outer membrane beta-barrel protein [Candidatus Krumholzibacteria bacterium]|nr:outer membrane beta-barrel protein [Candidatus Krumholzibacteria bacterium]